MLQDGASFWLHYATGVTVVVQSCVAHGETELSTKPRHLSTISFIDCEDENDLVWNETDRVLKLNHAVNVLNDYVLWN